MRGRSAWLILAFCAAVHPVAAEEPFVALRSPAPGAPLSGAIEIAADADAEGGVREVRFEVDGEIVAVLEDPPWRVVADVGRANREHTIAAIVVGRDGREARSAITSPAMRIDEEIELSLRQLYVHVRRDGEPVLDLGPSDFEIRDGGKRMEVGTFERGDVPLTALLLVDASESMAGERLRAALAGARAFVDRMAPLDQAALVLFSDGVRHASPFTSVPEVLSAGLGVVEAGGSTSLNDHLYLGLRLLSRRQGRRVLVVLSDGSDVTSMLPMAEVLRQSRLLDVQVHWIRLSEGTIATGLITAWRSADEHAGEKRALERLVETTGGRIWNLESIAEADRAFRQLLRELREQYVLGYYPPDGLEPGWREVEVRTRERGLDVRAPEGWTVP